MDQIDKISVQKTGIPNPDNSKLYKLLAIYQKDQGSKENYQNVLRELMNGSCFLLLSSKKSDNNLNEWTTTKEATSMNLSCIQEMDGIKVLAAFTDEDSLISWTKQPTQYTLLASKDVLRLCELNQVHRIVINNDLPNMFIMEKA